MSAELKKMLLKNFLKCFLISNCYEQVTESWSSKELYLETLSSHIVYILHCDNLLLRVYQVFISK